MRQAKHGARAAMAGLALMGAVVLVGALAATPARASAVAENAAPDNTGAFVAYCAVPAQRRTCRSRILLVDIAQLADKSCGYLGAGDKSAAFKAIFDWLAQHPETHTMATDEGILAAMQALWTCRLED